MKPIKLIMSGWGPYKDKVEVDFTQFSKRGLFLITGATGAGKTTIFDAITFALYGAMSGELRDKNSVRSDFASPATPTYIELWMEHGKKPYHIVRNPEYERPKKRVGGYTKEKENAILTLPDGQILEGVQDVNRKLLEILVIDYKQFKQISMIAQGEFARLLAAPPAEKTRIFREIFATSVYDRFAGLLRVQSGELYKKIVEYRNRIDEDLHFLENFWSGEEAPEVEGGTERILEQIDLQIETYRQKKVDEQKQLHDKEQQIHHKMDYLTQVRQNNKLIGQRNEAEQAVLLLETKRESIARLEEARDIARRAAVLEREYIRLEQEKNQAGQAQSSILKQQRELKELGKILEKQRPLFEERNSILDAYRLKEENEEAEVQLREKERNKKAREEEARKLQIRYLEQEALVLKKKKSYEEADLLYRRAAIGIAARYLKEGEPCPVCGSREHPEKAVVSADVPDEEGLKLLKAAYEGANAKLMELHGKAKACQGELAGQQKQFEEFLAHWEECRKNWEKVPEKTKSHLEKQDKKAFLDSMEQHQRFLGLYEEKSTALFLAEAEQKERLKKLEEMTVSFECIRNEAGFPSQESFEEGLKQYDRIQELEEDIAAFKEKSQAAEALLLHLRKETEGLTLKEEKPLEDEITQLNDEMKLFNEQLNALTHRIEDGVKIGSSIRAKEKKRRELEKEYGVVKDLDQLASGNNSRRLVFEQYVLAGYFEEILKAANLRLGAMTAGRFELFRMQEVVDGRTKDNLEIQVLDYYTGKLRSARTLSGGESFKASLSLALGMSDVIQSYSGGIRVEALFIDEGFGSLDSESLEQACETLLSLVEHDRIIGIISHVSELAERISDRIEITKTNTGSSLKVII